MMTTRFTPPAAGPRSIWAKLRRAWCGGGGRAPARDPRALTLQHLGLSGDELHSLQPLLQQVGRQLGVRLDLHRTEGDVVLAAQAFARDVSPQVLDSWREERPLVTLQPLPAGSELADLADRTLLARQTELLAQLRALPVVQRASTNWQGDRWVGLDDGLPPPPTLPPESSYDTEFDTRIDLLQVSAPPMNDAQQAMVHALLRRLHDSGTGSLRLSFGPRAHMRLDFDARIVMIDPLAQQMLRVRREVPLLDDHAQPGDEATARDLCEVVWDLGVACGAYRLIGQPEDWWHTPVEGLRLSIVAQCTRLPRHLELARLLAGGACTPSSLRTRAQTSVNELRRFLQAGLFLGVLYWAPWSRPDAPARPADAPLPPA